MTAWDLVLAEIGALDAAATLDDFLSFPNFLLGVAVSLVSLVILVTLVTFEGAGMAERVILLGPGVKIVPVLKLASTPQL